ncbi:MAG: SpoIIE family protein phosphatase [Clostridia bacterium]|nr:SpoIIE family protein phosphatase [Clostridia bacterium]
MFKRLRSKLVVKLVAGFILILLTFGLLSSVIGYQQFTRSLDEHYADNGYRICRLAGHLLVADDIMDYLDPEYMASDEYKTTMRRLDVMTQDLDAAFIYAMVPLTEDCSQVKFLFETQNENFGLKAYEPGYERAAGSDEYAYKYKLMMDGKSEEEHVFRAASETTTGAHVSAMIPIKDKEGKPVGILCVQRQMQALDDARNGYLINIAVTTLLMVALVALLFDWFLSSRVANPIRKIASETVRFSRENTLPPVSLTDTTPGEDEIKLLAMHVDKMEYAILNYTENLKNLRSERERFEGELHIASTIQKDMMPSEFPAFPERDEFDLYATMAPAREVGGDFYDFFFIDDDHLALIMADVSGKGVPAALFMMITKIILKNRAMQGGGPGDILADVNRQLCDGNGQNMFVTTWLGILNVNTGELVTASAGHEYPAICRADGSFEFQKDRHGFVLGGMNGSRYKEDTYVLQPGDSLFVYTDGVAEASNAEDELFGMDRMLTSLNKSPHASPDELIGILMDDIREFAGDREQFDDITMLAFRFKGQQSHLRTLKIEATVENLPQVTEWIEEMLQILDVPMKTQMQINLAAEEIFVNIAKYAYAPGVGDALIRIGYDMDTHSVRLTFLDNGTPYNPLGKEDPDVTLSAEDRAIGGLGIYLVKETMDRVTYLRNHSSNILTIEKSIERPEGI